MKRTLPNLVWRLTAPAVLFGALVCGACGAGNGSAGGGTPAATGGGERQERATAAQVDACALVTKAEADAVLGVPVGEPTRDDLPPHIFTCAYRTVDDRKVSVNVTAHDSVQEAAANFQSDIDLSRYPEIRGIGDRVYDGRPGGIFALVVLKGKYEVGVDVRTAEYEIDFEGNSSRARRVALHMRGRRIALTVGVESLDKLDPLGQRYDPASVGKSPPPARG